MLLVTDTTRTITAALKRLRNSRATSINGAHCVIDTKYTVCSKYGLPRYPHHKTRKDTHDWYRFTINTNWDESEGQYTGQDKVYLSTGSDIAIEAKFTRVRRRRELVIIDQERFAKEHASYMDLIMIGISRLGYDTPDVVVNELPDLSALRDPTAELDANPICAAHPLLAACTDFE